MGIPWQSSSAEQHRPGPQWGPAAPIVVLLGLLPSRRGGGPTTISAGLPRGSYLRWRGKGTNLQRSPEPRALPGPGAAPRANRAASPATANQHHWDCARDPLRLTSTFLLQLRSRIICFSPRLTLVIDPVLLSQISEYLNQIVHELTSFI